MSASYILCTYLTLGRSNIQLSGSVPYMGVVAFKYERKKGKGMTVRKFTCSYYGMYILSTIDRDGTSQIGWSRRYDTP